MKNCQELEFDAPIVMVAGKGNYAMMAGKGTDAMLRPVTQTQLELNEAELLAPLG